MSGAALAAERRGHGPAAMLLHGFAGSGRSLEGLARALAGEFETIAPDLPGHGRSVERALRADCTFDTCVDDLAATLDAAGQPRAHWLGYSMGARLALACAVRHPSRVASLVLLAGRAGIADPAERAARRHADEALAQRIESRGVEAFVDQWLAQPLFATLRRGGAQFMARERAARLDNDARGLAASLRALGPGAQPSLFDALPGLDVPVLLVAGALDERFVAAAHDLVGRLPHAEVRVIAGAGHAVHVEQPADCECIVRDFLRRVARPARSPSSPSFQETAS